MTQLWDGIFGQNRVKHSLEKFLLSNNIPQAIIFNGPEGIGKDFIAARFSRIINKIYNDGQELFTSSIINYIIPLPTGKNETSSDGPLDKLSNSEFELIVDEIEKKNKNPYCSINIPKANVIKLNSIREINKYLSLSFSEFKYRIILISSAHFMNEEAQNALLKNLEEPPAGVIFILTTSNLAVLKETIRSRCWIVDFEPLGEEDIFNILTVYFKVESSAAAEVKRLAMGSIITAINYIQNDLEYLKERVIIFLRNTLGGKLHTAMKELALISKENSEVVVEIFLKLILFWLIDVEKQRNDSKELFFVDHLETLEKFNSKFSTFDVKSAMSSIENMLYLYTNTNVNLNIIWFTLIFEINSVRNPHIKEDMF